MGYQIAVVMLHDVADAERQWNKMLAEERGQAMQKKQKAFQDMVEELERTTSRDHSCLECGSGGMANDLPCKMSCDTQTYPYTRRDMKPRGVKPPMHLIPRAALVWAARVLQYGNAKYDRGNFLLPVDGESPVEKSQEYCGAALRHLTAHTDHVEHELVRDGALGNPYPLDYESRLPHLAHALVSIMMAVQALVDGAVAGEDPK